jgi:GH43 family beta-xylosidase
MAMTPEWEWEEIGNNVFCDPAIFGKNESTGRSAEDDMFEMGLIINRADNKRVP